MDTVVIRRCTPDIYDVWDEVDELLRGYGYDMSEPVVLFSPPERNKYLQYMHLPIEDCTAQYVNRYTYEHFRIFRMDYYVIIGLKMWSVLVVELDDPAVAVQMRLMFGDV